MLKWPLCKANFPYSKFIPKREQELHLNKEGLPVFVFVLIACFHSRSQFTGTYIVFFNTFLLLCASKFSRIGTNLRIYSKLHDN